MESDCDKKVLYVANMLKNGAKRPNSSRIQTLLSVCAKITNSGQKGIVTIILTLRISMNIKGLNLRPLAR